LANDTVEEVKRNRTKCMMRKGDFEKACDDIKWDFFFVIYIGEIRIWK